MNNNSKPISLISVIVFLYVAVGCLASSKPSEESTLYDIFTTQLNNIYDQEILTNVKDPSLLSYLKGTVTLFNLNAIKELTNNFVDTNQLHMLKKHLDEFLQELKTDTSNIILFSIGGGGFELQEVPLYIKDLAHQFPTKHIKIYAINPVEAKSSLSNTSFIDPDNKNFITTSDRHYQHRNLKNLTLSYYRIFMPIAAQHPYSEPDHILLPLAQAIARTIQKGGIVLAGLHTSCYNAHDTSGIGHLYNVLKKNEPNYNWNNFKIYVQAGTCQIVVFDPPQFYTRFGEDTLKETPIWHDTNAKFFYISPGNASTFTTLDGSSFDQTKAAISFSDPSFNKNRFGFAIKEENNKLYIDHLIGRPVQPRHSLDRTMNQLPTRVRPKQLSGSYPIED